MRTFWIICLLSLTCVLRGQPADPAGQAGSPLEDQRERAHLILDRDNEMLPHIADGNYWKSTITLLNMDTESAQYRLRFFQSGGGALLLPIVGRGEVSEITGTLPVRGSITIETTGESETLRQGYVLLDSPNGKNLNGFGIFRQRLPWRQYDFEAVVPFSGGVQGGTRFYVVSFDNRAGSTTSMAIVNLNSVKVELELQFWDENGNRLDSGTEKLSLDPLAHVAFATDVQWPFLVNKRGMARFYATSASIGVPALVLRFNWSGPFTSSYTFNF